MNTKIRCLLLFLLAWGIASSGHSQRPFPGYTGDDSSWHEEEAAWFNELQEQMPIERIRQQHTVFMKNESLLDIQRFEFDYTQQIGSLSLATKPAENSDDLHSTQLDEDLSPFQYDTVIHAKSFDYVLNPQRNIWDMHARFAYFSPPAPPMPMAIRLQDHPRIQAETAFFQRVLDTAQNRKDSYTAQLAQDRLHSLSSPPSLVISKPVQVELTDGNTANFLGGPSGDELHFELDDLQRILHIIRIDSSGNISERIDNEYPLSIELPTFSDQEIGDIHPFHNITPEGDRSVREINAIGIRFSRQSGAWTIDTIWKNSPAEHAGLRQGDILVTVNQQDVSSMGLNDIPEIFDPPLSLDLQLNRNGKEVTAHVIKKTYKVMLLPDEPIPVY